MSMVEKVARAIFESQWRANSWDTTTHAFRKVCRDTARAAIEAMREPTEEMCEAGDRTGESGTADDGTQGETYYDMADVWKAMIDVALDTKMENPGSPATPDSAKEQ